MTDLDFSTRSYGENGVGYDLTTALMQWFADHAVALADRADPRVAIVRGDLTGLPPAPIVTAKFDPLRDEGAAYAAALAAAGCDAVHVCARGQIHSSIPMVDIVLSGAEHRARMAEAIVRFGARGGPAAA